MTLTTISRNIMASRRELWKRKCKHEKKHMEMHRYIGYYARCTMHTVFHKYDMHFVCMCVCDFWMADSLQAYSAPIHHSSPTCIFVPFSFFFFCSFESVFSLARYCMTLQWRCTIFLLPLVNTLALVQIISFLNVTLYADDYFSLAIIHTICIVQIIGKLKNYDQDDFDDILTFCGAHF